MKPANVVLLSAGKGTRLGKNMPKAAVEVNGKSLIIHQLETLIEQIPEAKIHVVLGYKAELVENIVENHFGGTPNNVELLYNHSYDTFGIMTSAEVPLLLEPMFNVLRLDGDLLFTKFCNIFDKHMYPTIYMVDADDVDTGNKACVITSKARHFNSSVLAFCERKVDEIVIRDTIEFEHIPIVSNERIWPCIEYYPDSTYVQLLNAAVSHDLMETGYYFEALNKWIAEYKPMLEIRKIDNVVEVDTPEDLKNAELFCDRKGL